MIFKSEIRRKAALLVGARFFDQTIQFLTPVLLVRFIDSSDFGNYRLLWLAINTLMAFAPLAMPRSLLYLLPRANKYERNVYVGQTLQFLFIMASLSAMILGPWNPLLPETIRIILSNQGLLISGFTLFWIFGHLLDYLPNAAQRIAWQANVIILLSILRGASIAGAAVVYGDLEHIIFALLAFGAIKSLLLILFATREFTLRLFFVDKALLNDQVRYSVPFGLSDSLYAMRRHVEQWVVAFLFSPTAFASFSLAATVLLPFNLIRVSIASILLPRMSSAYSHGRVEQVLDVNRMGNLAVSAMLYPGIAFVFVFADSLIELLFTITYADAAAVIRVYLIQLALTLEVGTLMSVLRQGVFTFKYNCFVLFLSVVTSFAGAELFGLIGAALGGVMAISVSVFLELFRASRMLSVKFSTIQRWRELFTLMAAAALSGVVTQIVFSIVFDSYVSFAALIGGSVFLVGMYSALLILFGQSWIIKAFLGRRSWVAASPVLGDHPN